MKLRHFEQRQAYRFVLTFENGEVKEVDLQGLIGQHVTVDSLDLFPIVFQLNQSHR